MNAIYFTQFQGPLEIKDIPVPTAAALGCRFATSYRGLIKRAHGYAVDINDAALAIAQSLGAETINSSKVNPVAFMQNLGGADVAVDALGSQQTASESVLSLARRGRHLQLGLLLTANGLTDITMARVIAWELDLLGSHGMAAKDYPAIRRNNSH